MERRIALTLLAIIFWVIPLDFAAAHHVLGRPACSLNEDSNTPPSMQAEVRIGDYMVTYMVFSAFPKPEQPGRVNLYATRFDDGIPYQGKVTYRARADSWFSWLGIDDSGKKLGSQPPDDNVYRQGYMFHEAGDYIIAAEFDVDGELYVVYFPLRIGDPAPIGPIGLAVGAVVILLLSVGVMQRRRAMTGRIRTVHDSRDPV
jgi:hypothetical protein